MTIDIDTVVVGAGVVGLAVARALALEGAEVLVLEAEDRPGEGISSRNSGVIHAGMYYPTGSLKARCCMRGLALMYDYCARRGIAHRRTGKLIVATEEQDCDELQALAARAHANGVDVSWLEGGEAMKLEPALHCVAALDSPNSGIVDVPELITALIGDLEHHGGRLLCRTEVHAVGGGPGWFRVDTAGGDALHCRRLVNAAGLGATGLATRIDHLDPKHVPRLWYGQGHYYNLRGRSPFTRLIYPLPGAASLGVPHGVAEQGVEVPTGRQVQRQVGADQGRALRPAGRAIDGDQAGLAADQLVGQGDLQDAGVGALVAKLAQGAGDLGVGDLAAGPELGNALAGNRLGQG